MGGTGKGSFKNSNTDVSAAGNQRQNFGVRLKAGDLHVKVGYSKIEDNYQAPGDWGTYGIYQNVNNVKGLNGGVGYKLSDAAYLYGKVAMLDVDNGTGKAVDSKTFGVDYKINGNWTLMASYEDTKFGEVGKNTFYGFDAFKYTTLGFGYNMGANTLFKLWYQVGDNTLNNPLAGGLRNVGNANKNNGSFIGAQFSVKF
jgi:hypothetical protein